MFNPRTIIEKVSATGKVQPETEVKISPEVAGEIIELPVVDGKEVKKGDLLVKIRPDSYKALLEQQQAAINTAQSVSGQQKAAISQFERAWAEYRQMRDTQILPASRAGKTAEATEFLRYVLTEGRAGGMTMAEATEFLRYVLTEGRALVMLDGLDEVTRTGSRRCWRRSTGSPMIRTRSCPPAGPGWW